MLVVVVLVYAIIIWTMVLIFFTFLFTLVPLWSYHWAFDGWRIYCDGSSIFSVWFAFLVSS